MDSCIQDYGPSASEMKKLASERCLQCGARLGNMSNAMLDYDMRLLYEREVLEPGHTIKHFYGIGRQLYSIGYTNTDGRYYQITCEYFAGKWIVN